MVYNGTRPADNDPLNISASIIRDNFEGLKTEIDTLAADTTNSLAQKADKNTLDVVAARLDVTYEKTQAVGNKSGVVAINAANGNNITLTAVGALTITLAASAPNGYSQGLILAITNGGAYAVTWPSNVKWTGGTAPSLTASGVDVITLYTSNSGATWYGGQFGGGFA